MKNSINLIKAALVIAGMLIFSGAFAQNSGLNTLSDSGYRGFVDGHFGAGRINGPEYEYNQWFVDFSTTHGYQFNKYFFAGAGVGAFWANQDKETFIPVYAAARLRFPGIEASPFAEARVGAIAANSEYKDATKIYLAGTLGAELTKRLIVNGRLTYSQNPFGEMIFFATVGLEFIIGK